MSFASRAPERRRRIARYYRRATRYAPPATRATAPSASATCAPEGAPLGGGAGAGALASGEEGAAGAGDDGGEKDAGAAGAAAAHERPPVEEPEEVVDLGPDLGDGQGRLSTRVHGTPSQAGAREEIPRERLGARSTGMEGSFHVLSGRSAVLDPAACW